MAAGDVMSASSIPGELIPEGCQGCLVTRWYAGLQLRLTLQVSSGFRPSIAAEALRRGAVRSEIIGNLRVFKWVVGSGEAPMACVGKVRQKIWILIPSLGRLHAWIDA